MAGEVAPERLGVTPLVAVVELLPDRAGELVHEAARVDEVEGADTLLRDPSGLVEKSQVGLDLPRCVRPLHLDRDLVTVRQDGRVHLADRRCRDGLLEELQEQPLDRLVELTPNRLLDLLEGERAHVVLQRS